MFADAATVHLPAEMRFYLTHLARSNAPVECCGALLGNSDFVDFWQVQRTLELTNRSESSATEYLITSDDVRFAQRKARSWSLDVIGFFHSHPNGSATPSPTDLERAWPGYIYIIVAGDEVTAWTLDEARGEFKAVEFAA